MSIPEGMKKKEGNGDGRADDVAEKVGQRNGRGRGRREFVDSRGHEEKGGKSREAEGDSIVSGWRNMGGRKKESTEGSGL